ncbi:hypothetical protein TNCV_2613961 [Trichonephila clavipes]|nr:hypothetical protein TNCV_2613961 [Trichonephila clavipes]
MWATEVQETVDLSLPMNSDSNAGIDNESLIKTAPFSNSLHCLESMKTYLIQQDISDAVLSLLQQVEKRALSSQQSKRFRSIYQSEF